MHRHYGYTLIELIVVLLIIGLTITIILPRLSLPDSNTRLDHHRHNIETLIHLARDQSIISGQILGLNVNDNKLSILRLKKGKWEPSNFSEPLRDYTPGAGYTLDFEIGSTLFPLPDGSKPYAMILPDGQMSPFSITLMDTTMTSGYEIHVSIDNTVVNEI